jgi:hypothetical protein
MQLAIMLRGIRLTPRVKVPHQYKQQDSTGLVRAAGGVFFFSWLTSYYSLIFAHSAHKFCNKQYSNKNSTVSN